MHQDDLNKLVEIATDNSFDPGTPGVEQSGLVGADGVMGVTEAARFAGGLLGPAMAAVMDSGAIRLTRSVPPPPSRVIPPPASREIDEGDVDPSEQEDPLSYEDFDTWSELGQTKQQEVLDQLETQIAMAKTVGTTLGTLAPVPLGSLIGTAIGTAIGQGSAEDLYGIKHGVTDPFYTPEWSFWDAIRPAWLGGVSSAEQLDRNITNLERAILDEDPSAPDDIQIDYGPSKSTKDIKAEISAARATVAREEQEDAIAEGGYGEMGEGPGAEAADAQADAAAYGEEDPTFNAGGLVTADRGRSSGPGGGGGYESGLENPDLAGAWDFQQGGLVPNLPDPVASWNRGQDPAVPDDVTNVPVPRLLSNPRFVPGSKPSTPAQFLDATRRWRNSGAAIDPEALVKSISFLESGGRRNPPRNPHSSAIGRFQVTDPTAETYVKYVYPGRKPGPFTVEEKNAIGRWLIKYRARRYPNDPARAAIAHRLGGGAAELWDGTIAGIAAQVDRTQQGQWSKDEGNQEGMDYKIDLNEVIRYITRVVEDQNNTYSALSVWEHMARTADAGVRNNPQRFQQGGLVPSPAAVGQAPQAGLNAANKLMGRRGTAPSEPLVPAARGEVTKKPVNSKKQVAIQQLNDELAEATIAASGGSDLVRLGIETTGMGQLTAFLPLPSNVLARFRPGGYTEEQLKNKALANQMRWLAPDYKVRGYPVSSIAPDKATVIYPIENMVRRGLAGSRSDIGHEFVHAGTVATEKPGFPSLTLFETEAVARHHDMVTGTPKEAVVAKDWLKRMFEENNTDPAKGYKAVEGLYNVLTKQATLIRMERALTSRRNLDPQFQQGGLVPSPAAVGQAPQAGLSELVNYTPRIAKEQNMNFPWLPQYQQGGLIPDAAAVGQAPPGVGQAPPGVGQAPPGVGQAGQTAPPVSPQEIEAEIQRMMQSNPQGVLQIKQVIQEQLQTGQLTQQEFNLAGQLAQAAAQNPQLWPKLRAFAIQQGLAEEHELSQEFDAGLVFTLLMAVRAVQSNIGGPGQPQATGQPGIPQQGQVAPPRPAGLAVPDASGQPPRRAFEGGGGAGKSRNIDGSISAVLHEGEFVIPQKVVQQKGTDFFNKLIDSDFGKSKGP